MHRARPNQSQRRGRVSAVVCAAPRETPETPRPRRAILGHWGGGAGGVSRQLPGKKEHERHEQPEKMRRMEAHGVVGIEVERGVLGRAANARPEAAFHLGRSGGRANRAPRKSKIPSGAANHTKSSVVSR